MIEPSTVRAPWLVEDRQLWSLYDMLRFYAMTFTAVMTNLERANMALTVEGVSEQYGGTTLLGAPALVKEHLGEVDKSLKEVPVTNTVRAQCARLLAMCDALELETHQGRAAGIVLLDQLKFNVINDLSEHLYLVVPSAHKALWDQQTPPFGQKVFDRFGDANRDIAAAARCLALDESTASVFHLMRALEWGLRDLANRVGQTFPTPIEYQEWAPVIEHIESKIKALIASKPKRTAE